MSEESIDIDLEEELPLTSEYPLRTDHLVKGAVVPVEDIERAFGVRRDEYRFGLTVLQARSYIMRRLEERGIIAFVAQVKQGLRILTDDEAHAYRETAMRQARERMERTHRIATRADRSAMSDAVRVLHDRALERDGRTLAAIKREVEQPVLGRASRSTPREIAGK